MIPVLKCIDFWKSRDREKAGEEKKTQHKTQPKQRGTTSAFVMGFVFSHLAPLILLLEKILCANWYSSVFHFYYPNTLSSQIAQKCAVVQLVSAFRMHKHYLKTQKQLDTKTKRKSRHASSGHCNLISDQLNNLLAVHNMQFLFHLLDSKTSFEIHCNVQNYKSNYNKTPLEWSFVIYKLHWNWFLF